jgi:hypothetical protein
MTERWGMPWYPESGKHDCTITDVWISLTFLVRIKFFAAKKEACLSFDSLYSLT